MTRVVDRLCGFGWCLRGWWCWIAGRLLSVERDIGQIEIPMKNLALLFLSGGVRTPLLILLEGAAERHNFAHGRRLALAVSHGTPRVTFDDTFCFDRCTAPRAGTQDLHRVCNA